MRRFGFLITTNFRLIIEFIVKKKERKDNKSLKI